MPPDSVEMAPTLIGVPVASSPLERPQAIWPVSCSDLMSASASEPPEEAQPATAVTSAPAAAMTHEANCLHVENS